MSNQFNTQQYNVEGYSSTSSGPFAPLTYFNTYNLNQYNAQGYSTTNNSPQPIIVTGTKYNSIQYNDEAYNFLPTFAAIDLFDAITITDSSLVKKVVNKPIAGSLTLSEQITGKTIGKKVNDTLGLLEVAFTSGIGKVVAENLDIDVWLSIDADSDDKSDFMEP